jgi:hypothetical protein
MSQILSFVHTQVCKLESEREVGLENLGEIRGMCCFVALLQPKFFNNCDRSIFGYGEHTVGNSPPSGHSL